MRPRCGSPSGVGGGGRVGGLVVGGGDGGQGGGGVIQRCVLLEVFTECVQQASRMKDMYKLTHVV